LLLSLPVELLFRRFISISPTVIGRGDSGNLSQAPQNNQQCVPPACELSVYLDGQRIQHECHPTYLGVTLDCTLSYREHLTKIAGKLKNRNNFLMKQASQFHLERQRQYSAVICFGALLFSSRVLRPSLVTLC